MKFVLAKAILHCLIASAVAKKSPQNQACSGAERVECAGTAKKIAICHFAGDKFVSICVNENGARNGHLKKHPLDYCGPCSDDVPVPSLKLKDFSAKDFNPTGVGPICFITEAISFPPDPNAITFEVNGNMFEDVQVSFPNDSEICFDGQLEEGQNSYSITLTDSSGMEWPKSEVLWAGSANVEVSLVDLNEQPFTLLTTVKAKLSDDTLVQSEAVTETGTASFVNMPIRTVLFEAISIETDFGTAGQVPSSQSLIKIQMTPFQEPSGIKNLNFEQGLEGWSPSSPVLVTLVEHQEVAGPPLDDRRHLGDGSFGNADMKVETGGEGLTSSTKTFEVIDPWVIGVIVRYRFVTSEVPGGFYGSVFNDYYSIVIRGQQSGFYESQTKAMNSLPLVAFDASGSTAWLKAKFEVETGENVQVDVGVANVGDGAFDSYVVVDYVEEITDALCIQSRVAGSTGAGLTDGHASLTHYSRDTETGEDIFKTYGLWPEDFSCNDGNQGDLCVNYSLDNPVISPSLGYAYPYIYCEPIDEDEVAKLQAEVSKEWDYFFFTNNCASFASEVFNTVTGTDVDNDDFCSFDTAREIGDSIIELNGGSNLPKQGLPWERTNRV